MRYRNFTIKVDEESLADEGLIELDLQRDSIGGFPGYSVADEVPRTMPFGRVLKRIRKEIDEYWEKNPDLRFEEDKE